MRDVGGDRRGMAVPPLGNQSTVEGVSSRGDRATAPFQRIQGLEFQPCNAGTSAANPSGRTDLRDRAMTELQTTTADRPNDGLFDQDVSRRLKYLTHLRAEHKRSPRTEADAAHAKAKTELLQIRIMEKQRTLVRRDAVDELIDQIAGTVLTHLSGMSARCSRDMQVQRNINAVVDQVRREMTAACRKAADECNEPPLDDNKRPR
jgi:hypothetical protein